MPPTRVTACGLTAYELTGADGGVWIDTNMLRLCRAYNAAHPRRQRVYRNNLYRLLRGEARSGHHKGCTIRRVTLQLTPTRPSHQVAAVTGPSGIACLVATSQPGLQ